MFKRGLQSGSRLFSTSATLRNRLEPADSARLTDIGTRAIFDEDYDAFRETCRKWFNDVAVPENHKFEEAGTVPREVWLSAGENGLLGCQTSDEYGGIGGDRKHAAIVWEEQSVANVSGPGFALHSDIVMPYISNFGTDEQKHNFLPKMTAGECIGAIAMTEPGAGSDLQGIRTYAKRDGDDWILNGSKTFITNGQNADVTIVVAITNPQAKSAAHGISLFLVEEGMPGFNKGKNLKKLGMKAQDTSELFFEDVRLPMSSIIGGEAGMNKGFYMLMKELPQERLLIGAMSLSNTESLFEETRDYIRERKAFGKPIANLQTIAHGMAEIKMQLAVARGFTDQCIELHYHNRLTTEMASINKAQMTDLQGTVLDKLLQFHGGYGYMWEYGVCRAFADARVQRIYGGSNEIMREIVSRNIVKKD